MKQISKLLLIAVGVVFLVGCGGGSGLSKAEKKANNAYSKGSSAHAAKEYAKAMRLYKEAIKQGSSNGKPEYNIGLLYTGGRGVPKDEVEALRWYRIAARKGNEKAMSSIGVYYEEGDGGLSVNYAEALKWYRRAREARPAGFKYIIDKVYIAPLKKKIAAAQEKQQAEQRRIAEAKRKAAEEKRLIAEAKERKRKIEALLARGDVNQRQADTNTAMHWAAADNEVELVQKLIAANADVNIVNKRADTPLHFAARANSREAVKALLRAGANPYKPNLKNESAMSIAVESGDEDLVGEFVLAGAEVNLLADLSTDKAQRDWEAEQEQKRQAEAKRLAAEAKKRAEAQAAEAKRLAKKQKREAERLAEAQRKAEAEARSQQRWADLTNTATRLAQNYAQLKTNINNTNRANAALAAAQQAATAAARQASAAERQAAAAEQQAATQVAATPKSSHLSLAIVETSERWEYGWSTGSSRLQADNEALRQCGLTSCFIVLRLEGSGCMAVATGVNGQFLGWAEDASSQIAAEQSAVNACGGGDCTVSKSGCVSW